VGQWRLLLTCASSSVDGDILLEMREEFAQMKAEMTKIAQLEAEITELKAKLNATTAGKLEFFADGAPCALMARLKQMPQRAGPCSVNRPLFKTN
jgi:hypothetical protein